MEDVSVNNVEENDSYNTKLEELLTSFDLTRMTLPQSHLSDNKINWLDMHNMDLQHIETSIVFSGLFTGHTV